MYNGDMGKKLSVTEAARYMGVSKQRISQLVKAGRIPAKRIGRVVVIDSDDLDDLKRNREIGS